MKVLSECTNPIPTFLASSSMASQSAFLFLASQFAGSLLLRSSSTTSAWFSLRASFWGGGSPSIQHRHCWEGAWAVITSLITRQFLLMEGNIVSFVPRPPPRFYLAAGHGCEINLCKEWKHNLVNGLLRFSFRFLELHSD